MIKGRPYMLMGGDAAKYGVQAAMILYSIRLWIDYNKSHNKHFHDGRTWTYNSHKAFAELFPFLSTDQIRRALEKLVQSGALVTGNYNETDYDRTLWYALGDEGT